MFESFWNAWVAPLPDVWTDPWFASVRDIVTLIVGGLGVAVGWMAIQQGRLQGELAREHHRLLLEKAGQEVTVEVNRDGAFGGPFLFVLANRSGVAIERLEWRVEEAGLNTIQGAPRLAASSGRSLERLEPQDVLALTEFYFTPLAEQPRHSRSVTMRFYFKLHGAFGTVERDCWARVSEMDMYFGKKERLIVRDDEDDEPVDNPGPTP